MTPTALRLRNHVAVPHGLAGAQDTVRVPITSLAIGDSPRLAGSSDGHVEVLAASDAVLPPLLVHRSTMRVIDGVHRLRAALLRDEESVEVRFFEGSGAEAFVEAVRANIAHGLPLTLADRQAAASRIADSHPHHSDRWIAAVTGLAAGTVAAIRRQTNPEGGQPTARVGRDGRIRPVNGAEARRTARDAITEHPEASLREIARMAGISPNTARDVRQRMRRGEDPVPSRLPDGQSRQRADSSGSRKPASESRDRASLMQVLRQDPSLRLSESGRALLRWLDAMARGPEFCEDLVDAMPPHCAYVLVELSARCAEDWRDVTSRMEHRLRKMK
jgi:ParB-like chromosome segregation protein Spo0J